MTYTVVGLLGRGGMAVVELAVDDRGRHVARKRIFLSGSAQNIDVARRRIRREAEILSGLRHPGILPLLAVEDDGHDLVLVMPRMAGSLADRVATFGPLPPAEMAGIGHVLLDALAMAHRQGVVHRDIKPANVLFDRFGRPVLADFGVAVTRGFTPGLTTMGTVIGTPEFMAPEQARGAPATPASDVFALGATIGYGLTGHGPYGHGEPLVLMARAAKGRITPLPRAVPPSLRRPLTGMLDPRPERRPSAAGALGGTTGTKVQPVPVKRRPRVSRWRKVAAVAAGLVVAAAAVAAGIEASGGWRRSTNQTAAVAHGTVPTTAPCTPLPYQPCGAPPAAFTDGRSCLPGHADFDGIAANGCEAASTYTPGTVLDAGKPILANLVPASTTDVFRAYVKDNLLDFCTGSVRVTLTAPPGVTMRVEVAQGSHVLASAQSQDGTPATAEAGEPSCFSDNSAWLTIRVSGVGARTAADFRLTRNSSW
jgi:tRNA A-37 threonylcarbamoyl transferase component Bud32